MSSLIVDSLPNQEKQLASAWVNFNGTGTVSIRDSYNVDSITDNGTGIWDINVTTAMANTDFSVYVTGSSNGTAANTAYETQISDRTTSKVRVASVRVDTTAAFDSESVNVIIFGGTA